MMSICNSMIRQPDADRRAGILPSFVGGVQMGRLQAAYRYPLKSMGGESLAAIELEGRGIPGDRAGALRGEKRSGIRGAKRFAERVQCRARYEGDPPLDGSMSARVTPPDEKRCHGELWRSEQSGALLGSARTAANVRPPLLHSS